jgi:GAF domain-containing protein
MEMILLGVELTSLFSGSRSVARCPKTPAGQGDQSMEELRRELAEAREQQAATAQVLAAISNSPTDPNRVFADIASTAARLCDAYDDATIHQVDHDQLRLVAHHGPILTGPTMPKVRGALVGRAVLERRAIQVADLAAEGVEYPMGSKSALGLGFRTTLAVPLIRAGDAIGVIAIRRTEVRPFSDRQADLLKSFAAQAVIAIENTRLFDETKEALERQTVTAEILKVIASSPSDTRPVFNAIATSANRLLGGLSTAVWRFEGGKGYLVAFTRTNATVDEALKALSPTCISGSPILGPPGESKIAQILDTEEGPPRVRDVARLRGYRAVLVVPLMSQAVPIGLVSVTRKEPGAFDPDDVLLLQTFADQAVIAIENTRLFEAERERTRELTESLEYQTATAEVLNIISRSPSELQHVLDAIVATATGLCDGFDASIFLKEGDRLTVGAHHGGIPLSVESMAL